MFSKPLAFGLLALGCVTAAAGGAYLATRHNASDATVSAPAPGTTPAAASTAGSTARPQPVSETEAVVGTSTAEPGPVKTSAPAVAEAPAIQPTVSPRSRRAAEHARAAAPKSDASGSAVGSAPNRPAITTAAIPEMTPASQPVAVNPPAIESARTVDPPREPVREPQFEEVVLPPASVIGLRLDTPLSSERARLEDRVDAQVMRDVMVNGRVAIPAGSRILGSVTLVDRGGKLKEPARLGIRFHTLILADGAEVALHTDPILRYGESPAGDSAKKIGGAAIGGAILGAILGGGKGAVIGGTTGAAGGTAVVMAGDRTPVTLSPGTVFTAHLSSPVTIQIEKR